MRSPKALAAAAAFLAVVAASEAADAQTLLRDAEIEDFLDDHSRPIFEAAGIEPDSIEILLLDGPPNAFAGGRIMGVFTGLITLADTPNQIEGVIAHEAGHIAGGHTARSGEAMASASRPMILGLLLAAGAAAAGAPDAAIGLIGLGQSVGVANYLKYSRGQESSADQAAVSYLDRLGLSSAGLIEFFGKLRNEQVITARQPNPYLQTHPLANARIVALQERATTSPNFAAKDSEEEILRLRMIQAKIHGFLDAAHYTLRRYPLSDVSAPARYARSIAWYRSADIDKALAAIDSLIAEQPENQYFHELKGQMLFEFGRVADAVAPNREAVRLDPSEPLLRIGLGRALLASGSKAELEDAVREFKTALLVEPDNSFAWFELARAYGALDQEPLAHLATAESKYHAGDKQQAVAFARRALAGLEEGTPEWRQAQDVIVAALGEKAPDALLPAPAPTEEAPAPREGPAPRGDEVPDPPAPNSPSGDSPARG